MKKGLELGFRKLLEFDGNVADVFMHDFCVEYDYFGEKRVDELKPGGSKIPLTNKNREGKITQAKQY